MYGVFDVAHVCVPNVGERFEDIFQLLSISVVLFSYVDVVSPVVSTFGFDRLVGLVVMVYGVR